MTYYEPYRDTMCACGCGLWTHKLTRGGNGKVYYSGHEPVNPTTVPNGQWIKLNPHQAMRSGDRVGHPQGAALTRHSVGIGNPAGTIVSVYRWIRN